MRFHISNFIFLFKKLLLTKENILTFINRQKLFKAKLTVNF